MIKKFFLIIILLVFTHPLLQAQEIFQAVRMGDLQEVKSICETDAEMVNQKEERYGATLLIFAALEGNLDIVQYLIDKGAEIMQGRRLIEHDAD